MGTRKKKIIILSELQGVQLTPNSQPYQIFNLSKPPVITNENELRFPGPKKDYFFQLTEKYNQLLGKIKNNLELGRMLQEEGIIQPLEKLEEIIRSASDHIEQETRINI